MYTVYEHIHWNINLLFIMYVYYNINMYVDVCIFNVCMYVCIKKLCSIKMLIQIFNDYVKLKKSVIYFFV